ncbi:hypothetical protein [Orbus hercynius]|nr:hypothetical protein [Orbus hercynius]
MSNFVKLGEQSSNYHQADQIPIVNSLIEISTNIWLYIISGIVLYILVKLSRRFFQTPLIDSFAQSHQQKLPSSSNQLNSNMTQQDSSKFYAIIFASIFCFVSNGAMWNIYFRIFSSVYEINVLLNEYDNMIFLFGFASVIFSYVFLYCISQKFILKTYSWLPISSLLTASTITLILFGISSLMISCFMLPFVFAFHSIILLLLWFIVCYAVLYCLTRFALRRYFA